MNEVFLGIIAVAVALMAAIQVGAVIVAARLAKRVDRLADQIERDIRPVVRNLHTLSGEAARAASLAAVQVERADRLFGDLAHRVDVTLTTLQTRVLGPAREGAAVLAGLRAALATLRDRGDRRRRPSPVEEEDALFIG
ncbi:MAG: hypothetical protein ACRD26_05320 [Vicinamibacterales bacterium]